MLLITYPEALNGAQERKMTVFLEESLLQSLFV